MFHTSIFHFSHTLQKNSMYTSLLSETDTEMSNLLLEINVTVYVYVTVSSIMPGMQALRKCLQGE